MQRIRHSEGRPQVTGFFDSATSSVQYVVVDPDTRRCAIIDPVLDFDAASGETSTASADELLGYVKEHGLEVEWVLDTHPHADHLSAAQYLKQQTGAPTAIGQRITEVQALWKDIYHWPELACDGSQWDRLWAEGDRFSIGNLEAEVMFSPGHTLASVTYRVGDAAFVHDTLFQPDFGTARADFPGGDAQALWQSIQDLLALPDDTRLFTGHDYRPGGREPRWESTVAEQRRDNIHLQGQHEAGYIAMRNGRDKDLPMPALMLPSLQVNILGGRLPKAESNGRRYLKIPLNAF